MKLTLHKGQKIQVTMSPTSLTGKNLVPAGQTPSMVEMPAGSATLPNNAVAGEALKMKSAPQWTVEKGDVKVTPSKDGLSAWITAGDDFGISQVRVEAEIDLGQGMQKIAQEFEVTVEDPLTANLGLKAGAAMHA